ncbi:MAG: hypothetical protein KGM24_14800 [Elusimicrobia bacterium]|nr:hypothetical protein [Elusimicrobiota bacterium]
MKPLNPVMAALLAASSAAFLPPGNAFAGGSADQCYQTVRTGNAQLDAAAQKMTDDLARQRIACVLGADASAKKDVAKRLESFVESPLPGGASLLSAPLRTDLSKMRPSLVAAVSAWVETSARTADDLSALYFLLGPDGTAPDWVDRLGVAQTMSRRGACIADLGGAMSNLLSDGTIQPLDEGDLAARLESLLNQTTAKAHEILADQRCKADIEASIAANQAPMPEPPTSRGAGNPLGSSGAGFSFDDLYRNGAVVGRVWGSKDDGYRTLSMKIYTVRDGDGFKNQIGIVDITDPTHPYAPHFVDLTQNGPVTFSLKDGGRQYTLNVTSKDGVQSISLARADGADGGQAFPPTSVQALLKARADQASQSGVVSVGGKRFHVLGQGGVFGRVLFFSDDSLDSPDPQPELMAKVAMVNHDGYTVPVNWMPDLGDVDGKPYHLEFDRSLGMWKPVAGKSPKPEPQPQPTADATKTGSGPAAGPTQPSGSAPDVASASSLDAAVAAAQQAGWKAADTNSGFDDATRAKVRIMTDGDGKVYVLYAPDMKAPGNQVIVPDHLTTGPTLENVSGAGPYIVLKYDGPAIFYFTPDQLVAFASGKSTDNSGSISGDQINGVTDVRVALDMLVTYFDVSPDDARLDAMVKAARGLSGTQHISGSKTLLVAYPAAEQIWPEVKTIQPGVTSGGPKLGPLAGPGTAFVSGDVKSDFPPHPQKTASRVWTIEKKQSDIALYSGKEDERKDGKVVAVPVYGVSLKFVDDKKETRVTAPIEVFGGARLALPKDLHMKGLGAAEISMNAQMMLYHGSTAAKGAVAVYRSALPAAGGNNIQDPQKNCAGAILWWGMSESQAQKACPSGSL